MNTKKQFTNLVRKQLDEIDVGNSEINEEQMLRLAEEIAHLPMSKESASRHLHMSTKKFDKLVNQGWLPKGRKEFGWKELRWYKDELDKAVKRLDE